MIIGSQRQSQVILFIFKADHYIDFFSITKSDAALKVTNKNFKKKNDLTVGLCAEWFKYRGRCHI